MPRSEKVRLTCTFCYQTNGGKEGFRNVNCAEDCNVLRALNDGLQQTAVGVGLLLLTSETPVLCTKCFGLYAQFRDLQVDFQKIKTKLDDLLSKIQAQMNSVHPEMIVEVKSQPYYEFEPEDCEITDPLEPEPGDQSQSSKEILKQKKSEGAKKKGQLPQFITANVKNHFKVLPVIRCSETEGNSAILIKRELDVTNPVNEDSPFSMPEIISVQIKDDPNLTVGGSPSEKLRKTKTFDCEICKNTRTRFRLMSDFKVHIKDSHKSVELLYACSQPDCDRKYPVKLLFDQHMKYHAMEHTHPYGCADCDLRYKRKDNLACHQKKHGRLASRKERISHCRFCKITRTRPADLRAHEIKEHSDKLLHFCDKCDQKYSSAFLLETHKQTHGDVTSGYSCPPCDAHFEKETQLEDHLIRYHIPKEQFNSKPKLTIPRNGICPVCGKYYKDPGKLSAHLRRAHYNKPSFSCELCPEKSYTSLHAILTHTVKHHESVDESEKGLSCPQCPKKFLTNFMFDRHIKGHALDGVKSLACDICHARYSADDQASLDTHIKSQHGQHQKKVHNCTGLDCDKSYHSQTHLRRHELEKHPELFIHTCHICSKAYSVKAILDTHVKTHYPKIEPTEESMAAGPVVVFGCELCPSKFTSPKGLANHLLKHSGETKIQCDKCPKKFYTSRELEIHMARHHGGKLNTPFKCDVCPKRFQLQSQLKNHMEIHLDPSSLPTDNPKPCNHCGKVFPTRRLLRNHKSKSHRVIPSKICEICGESVLSDRFKMHMLRHAGIKSHVCYFCDRRFLHINSLRVHVNTHTKEKPCICQICRLEFTQSHCLKNHMKKAHEDNSQNPNPGPNVTHRTHNNNMSMPQLEQFSQQVQQHNYLVPYMPVANVNYGRPMDFEVLME